MARGISQKTANQFILSPSSIVVGVLRAAKEALALVERSSQASASAGHLRGRGRCGRGGLFHVHFILKDFV